MTKKPIPPLSQTVFPWFLRKLTAAAFTSVMVAAYLAADYSEAASAAWPENLTAWLGTACVLLLYVTPVYYIFGVPASMLCEFALVRILRFRWLHGLLSICAHAFFGWLAPPLLFDFPLGSISIGGVLCAAAFFVVDLILSLLSTKFSPSHAVRAFIFLPLAFFFVGMIGIRL